MNLKTIIKNLFSGQAHDHVEPVVTDLEKALLKSLQEEPHMWHLTETTKDGDPLLIANNREKGVIISCYNNAAFRNASAWSGKLRFSPTFDECWSAEAIALFEHRVAAETTKEAAIREKEIRATFKL